VSIPLNSGKSTMRNTPTNGPKVLTDDQLLAVVVAFRDGDRQAFRALYNRYERSMYRFCRHLVGDDALASDAFQETFVRMFEHRDELRTDNIQSWLFSIARRVCLNMLRTKRAGHEAFDEAMHTHEVPMYADVLLREHLERAMQQLPVTLREALILRDIEGHSYNEIAEIVGIDLSLAKVRVYRARLHMRKLLMPIVAERQRLQ
jgi:RNA polymerase sigma-70 factor (ECF subfamily)